MYLAFEFGDGIFRSPILNGAVMTLVAALMVSRVPTFSMKRFRVPHDYVVPIMLAIAVVAAFLTTAPWPTLSVVGIVYLASIPMTVRSFNKRKREAMMADAARASDDPALALSPDHREIRPESQLPH
jgi:CDP-diacylglycerol---serine O-phosphatidyltransferase